MIKNCNLHALSLSLSLILHHPHFPLLLPPIDRDQGAIDRQLPPPQKKPRHAYLFLFFCLFRYFVFSLLFVCDFYYPLLLPHRRLFLELTHGAHGSYRRL